MFGGIQVVVDGNGDDDDVVVVIGIVFGSIFPSASGRLFPLFWRLMNLSEANAEI